MKRRTLVQASLFSVAAACTGVSSSRSPPKKGDERPATVVPEERHDESPPLRDIPPTPRPPDDMKREVPIHRLPLPPGK